MWDTRNHAMSALEVELKTEAEIIYQAFALLDEMIDTFNSSQEASAFSRVTGLTLLKARNFSKGIFSLSLDGLAQEAGALLRPLIECIEFIRYLCDDPQRVDEVLEERVPAAGIIAQKINGKFQGLRNYLNEHASHFSFQPQAMNHLIDFSSENWRVVQPYNEKVLRKNMSTLFAVLLHLLLESANCLAVCGLLSDSLGDRLGNLRENGLTIFKRDTSVKQS